MAQHWRCEQCGTFHGSTSRFQEVPEECRECGHAEFETLVQSSGGGMGSALSRSLNLDAFTWMAMGMAIFNIIFALLGGFADLDVLMYSAGASFVLLLLTAYLLSNRSWASWVFALVVFVGVTAWGLVLLIPRVILFFELAPPIPVYAEDGVLLLYGILYAIFGFIGLAMLMGGRAGIKGKSADEDALHSSG